MDYITEQLREHIELPDHGEVCLIEHKDITLFSGHLIRRTAPLAQRLQLITSPVCIMKKIKAFIFICFIVEYYCADIAYSYLVPMHAHKEDDRTKTLQWRQADVAN